MKKSAALLALVLLAGCNDQPAPVVEQVKPVEPPKAPVKSTTPARPTMAPPLTDVQKQFMNKAFADARELVKKAREFKAQGAALLKSSGAAAANAPYVQAKELYNKATGMTEDWVEPDLGKVTEAQVRDYLEAYNSERGRWIMEAAELGKVHKDD